MKNKIKLKNKEYFLTKEIKIDNQIIYKFSSLQDNIFCKLENGEYKKIEDKKLVENIEKAIRRKTDII